LQQGDTHWVRSAVFSNDGSRFVIIYYNGVARLWDTAPRHDQTLPVAGITSAAFSPDGKRIVTGSQDGTARVWDAATRNSIVPLRVRGKYINSVEFSPDGKRIVTGSQDGTARVWDAATGDPLESTLHGDGSAVLVAAFSHNRIVTASPGDGMVRVWKSGRIVAKLQGKLLAPLSRDGSRMIIQSNNDRSAEVFDVASSRSLALINGNIKLATFTSDASRILTVSEDNEQTVSLWRLFPSLRSMLDEANDVRWQQNMSGGRIGAAIVEEPHLNATPTHKPCAPPTTAITINAFQSQ
jgi:WD40 repeat protein